jgi:hypothetical protein
MAGPLDLGPDDIARILRGARKCPDSHRDAYFAYCAERLKYYREPLDQITADAVQRFGTSKRPRRRDTLE